MQVLAGEKLGPPMSTKWTFIMALSNPQGIYMVS